MSYAEIKKAINSDLSVPLNELINRMPIREKTANPITINNSSYTLLKSVNGSGWLYSAAFYNNATKKISGIKITIDDNVVLDISGYSSYPVWGLINQKEFVKGYYNYSTSSLPNISLLPLNTRSHFYAFYGSETTATNMQPLYRVYDGVDFYGNTIFPQGYYHGEDNLGEYIYMGKILTEPIRFEKSFKVEGIGNNASTLFEYSLDD